MPDTFNYFPNPDLRTTNRTEWVLGNDFPNPTPTVDLTHWSAVGGGSITRTADASLFDQTSYGCRAVNGVNLAIAEKEGYGRSVTVKVRAVTAMTITGSVSSEYIVNTREIGWGTFGWGEPANYEPGAAKVFTAGQTSTFRVYFGPRSAASGGNYPGGSAVWNPVVTLTGTGTFDVDGVVEWVGVDDGYEEGGVQYNPPNAPPFFDGDSPAGNGVTYGWVGTPHDSPSVAYGQVPKYVASDYDFLFDGIPELPSAVFSRTLDGENVATLRGAFGFGHNEATISDGTSGTLNGLGLAEGQDYVLTFEIVTDYRNAWSGYWENQWGVSEVSGTVWEDRATQWVRHAYQGVNGVLSPYRTKHVVPFTYTAADLLSASIHFGYLDWTSGEVYLANVGIFETQILLNNESWTLTDGTKDLTALGVLAGGSYHLSVEWLDELCDVRVEYQTTAGGGTWTVLAQAGNAGVTEEFDFLINASLNFTVPADATAVRFRSDVLTSSYSTVNLTTGIPEFFHGDTPDTDDFEYSWEGTPGDSVSVRSPVLGADIDARVVIDGTAVEVTAIRFVTGGALTSVLEIGN